MAIDPISSGGRRAVFLDRDGTPNRAVGREGRPYPPDSVAALEIFRQAAGWILLHEREGQI